MKKFFLLFIVGIFVLPTIVCAESVQMGKFKYMPAFSEQTEETYYYSDDYFRQSGTVDNEHLLGMSYNLALSTFEVRNYTYSKELLEAIGFKDIQANDMIEKPTLETIGTVIAHKKIDGSNVIVVAIRGEKYDSEWGNNFIVGKEGDAKGFSDTSVKVINRIQKYISDYSLDNVKLWMVGYSRAGAVADLVGVYVNKNLEEFHTTVDDLYIYTYEAPAASTDNTIYDNIYTVRSINDLIPMVYPKEWRFYHNGKVINIGEASSITTYIGLEEQVEYDSVEMQEFYGQFFGWLTSRLDREAYVEYLEEPVSKLFDIYFSKSEEDRETLKNFFLEDVKGVILDNQENFGKLKSKIWSVMGHNSDYLYESIAKDIVSMMNEVRNNPNGLVLTDEEYSTITNSIQPLLRVLGPVIIDDASYYDGIDYDDYYTNIADDYYLTDEEMGNKYGQSGGSSKGYDDGFFGNPKDEYSYDENEANEYGPYYFGAYKNAYISAYLENYELGKSHREDLVEKGKYDGVSYAYDTGYHDGSYGEEYTSYDVCFYEQDWMTEEYKNAYNEAYEEEYRKGYEDGLNNPALEEEEEWPEQKNLYHVLTLVKNASDIMKMHHPQENLKLIHSVDSYYAPYNLTEGADQVVNMEDDEEDNLTFKTSGHLEKLVKVQVDGKDLDVSDYEVKSGSTIVTLKDSFLQTLSAGTHTLKMIYIDNTIETNFMVHKREYSSSNEETSSNATGSITGNPDTGDSILFDVLMLVISLFGLAFMIGYTFKNKIWNS